MAEPLFSDNQQKKNAALLQRDVPCISDF